MQAMLTQELRLEQTLSPRMIQFYRMLQCPVQELSGIILQELADNPALELVDVDLSDSLPDHDLETIGHSLPSLARAAADDDDLMTHLPAPVSLRDHLRQQFHAVARTPDELQVGLRLIEDINADGYFEGQIGDIAMVLQVSVIEVERILGLLQHLDPAGVAARDLRECLQIQLEHWAEDGRHHAVASMVVDQCFELFARRQFTVCARRLKVAEAAVADAAEWLRQHCHPYPGRDFRLPWQDAPVEPQALPEVRLKPNPTAPPAYVAEMRESERYAVRVDRVYRRLYREIEHGGPADQDEADHVRHSVRRARQFIRAIDQRRETVKRIAEEVANEQAEFVARGPAHLRPLTRIEIARRLGVHESTIGRAVAGKFVMLPSGEVVPLEAFFDGAQPVKLALQRLVDGENARSPLSDSTLSERLAEQGFDIARRTVAKYRQELKIPPASQRRRK